jgi:hypothetical protein
MNIIGGKLELKGDLIYDNGFTIRYRKLNDDEVKTLFDNIKLNTGFSLPEIMVQDFVQDGAIEPTFKKCVHFNKNDLQNMVKPFKKYGKHKKKLPKLKSLKKHKKKVKKTHIKK